MGLRRNPQQSKDIANDSMGLLLLIVYFSLLLLNIL